MDEKKAFFSFLSKILQKTQNRKYPSKNLQALSAEKKLLEILNYTKIRRIIQMNLKNKEIIWNKIVDSEVLSLDFEHEGRLNENLHRNDLNQKPLTHIKRYDLPGMGFNGNNDSQLIRRKKRELDDAVLDDGSDINWTTKKTCKFDETINHYDILWLNTLQDCKDRCEEVRFYNVKFS